MIDYPYRITEKRAGKCVRVARGDVAVECLRLTQQADERFSFIRFVFDKCLIRYDLKIYHKNLLIDCPIVRGK